MINIFKALSHRRLDVLSLSLTPNIEENINEPKIDFLQNSFT